MFRSDHPALQALGVRTMKVRFSHSSASPSSNRANESDAESQQKDSSSRDVTRLGRPQSDVLGDAAIVENVFNNETDRMEFRPSKMGPQHILKEDVPSKVGPNKLEEIREWYGIPDDVEIQAPEGDERIDYIVEGWTPMYTLWLSLGLSFPISGLVRHFYKSLMISPS